MFGEYLEFQNVHSPKTKIAKRMNLNDIGNGFYMVMVLALLGTLAKFEHD